MLPTLVWIIPAYGKEGYIEDKASGKVLGVTDDSDSQVHLADKIIPLTQDQNWLRVQTNYTQFYVSFEFINQKYGRLLSVGRDQEMTLSGNVQCPPIMLIRFHCYCCYRW